MEPQRNGPSPETILRLADVLRKTGLSRSTLYNRIRKREFPHQVSLGGRAIGWLCGEVEDWIKMRLLLRPYPALRNSEQLALPASGIADDRQKKVRETKRSSESTGCVVSVIGSPPNPAQLYLVGTKIYFDESTGDFWLRLQPES